MMHWILKLEPSFPSIIEISNELKDLIKKCLKKNPEDWIGFKHIGKIKDHEWFKDIDFDKILSKKISPPLK